MAPVHYLNIEPWIQELACSDQILQDSCVLRGFEISNMSNGQLVTDAVAGSCRMRSLDVGGLAVCLALRGRQNAQFGVGQVY